MSAVDAARASAIKYRSAHSIDALIAVVRAEQKEADAVIADGWTNSPLNTAANIAACIRGPR